MMIELIVFIALACVCVLVAPFVGLRRRLASEEKKKTHALLKQLESEVGGVLIQHPDLVLSEYELGDGTAGVKLEGALSGSSIVTETAGIGSNDVDSKVPSVAAVKDYVDGQVAGSNLVEDLLHCSPSAHHK